MFASNPARHKKNIVLLSGTAVTAFFLIAGNINMQKLHSCKSVLFYCGLFFFTICNNAMAQTPSATENQLEAVTDNSGDAEMEDDYYQQQMEYYRKHPLNLNTAQPADLRELGLLSPLQAMNFMQYRNLLGSIIDIYELQAVPGWDIGLIVKLRPYVTVSTALQLLKSVREKMHGGEKVLLLRFGQVLEKARGFSGDTLSTQYAGSPQKILLRYKYNFNNQLQYGVVAEKDAGEQLFGRNQQTGFDFYSVHFFVRKAGVIKNLALGDFSVNLGQGLVQWQGMPVKKTADVMHTKQEAAVLRPYSGAGEINFHRGAGLTLMHKNTEATFFISYKKMDANIVTDSTLSSPQFVSSFQTSGYHRTVGEIADKGVQAQMVTGGNIRYRRGSFHFGFNMVRYQFGQPVKKAADLYNLYAVSGSRFANYSLDYSYTFRNMHFFGEAASNNRWSKALISGVLLSARKNADVALVYRNISPGYYSFYSGAFTENALPSNEKGLYVGLSLRPSASLRVDAYTDFFKFPWLKYRTSMPSYGSDYLVQITCNPAKQLEMYCRWVFKSSGFNLATGVNPIPPVTDQKRKTWRFQVKYRVSPQLTWQARAETVWWSTGQVSEQGFLGFSDIFFKPVMKQWALNGRILFFDTDSYNSRLYAYENDVLYNNTAPVFYGRGFRTCINASYSINDKITVWVKLGQSIYSGKTSIGTGPDAINGNRKTEIKVQGLYKF